MSDNSSPPPAPSPATTPGCPSCGSVLEPVGPTRDNRFWCVRPSCPEHQIRHCPPASDAPAPPLRCPLCGSTMVHPIVAYGKPALECSQCNHWGTLEWGFEQAGARAARLAASPALNGHQRPDPMPTPETDVALVVELLDSYSAFWLDSPSELERVEQAKAALTALTAELELLRKDQSL